MVKKSLFADAEAGEDSCKYLCFRDFASNCADVVEGFAEILGDQVGRGAGGNA